MSGMQIYLTDIRAFGERELYRKGLEYVPPGRASRTVRLKAPLDRQRSLGAGLLSEYGLRQYGFTTLQDNYPYTTVEIDRGEYGKPSIPDTDVRISISHSGDYAVAAFSEREIGIDIERVRTANQHLVSRFFSENEKEYWNEQTSYAWGEAVDADRLFARLWTRKESYIKMTGEGMRTDLASFSVIGDTVEFVGAKKPTVSFLGDDWSRIDERILLATGVKEGIVYRLVTVDEPEGYMMSVCERAMEYDALSTINITFVDGEQLCMMN